MIKRILLILLTVLSAERALATDYTDLWWNPSESGWGVTLVQNDPFIFATFFIYGADGKPTWYTGQLNSNTNGNFVGLLYATTGPYFGAATFNPSQVSTTAVGNVMFEPTAADQGTLTYNVGSVNVTKHIERQTLSATSLSGNYRGGVTSSVGGCADTSLNRTSNQFADITVAQSPTDHVQINISEQNGVSCTLQGTVMQSGRIYRPATMTYACSSGINALATLYEAAETGQGVEGRWIANLTNGCIEDVHFSGVAK